MIDPAEFVIIGRVRKAHGIRGEVVVESLTDAPDAIFAAGRRVFAGTPNGNVARDRQELHIQRASPFKGGWLVHFAEIADRNAAELWRERYLLVPSDEVEPPAEGEVYVHELQGMRVRLEDGTEVGEISATFELPNGLLIEVKREGREPALLPYEAVVIDADRVLRVITIAPPEGLLD
jgi:16S rRNA processing protein RimM